MRHTSAGFSVIELVLVLALVGVVALFSISMGIDSIARSAVTSERDLFVSLLLRGARAASLANINEASHGIKIDNAAREYILFEGTTYSEGSTSNRRIPFTSTDIMVTNTGGDTIVFEQLSGSVSTGVGTITMQSGDKTQTITIRATGQIDW